MKLHHVAVSVNSLEESIRFYTSYFGGKVVKEFERSDLGGKAVFLECDNLILELWEFTGKKDSPEIGELKVLGLRHIAFAVSDLDKTVQDMKRSGIESSAPKLGASGGRYSFTKDPNGIPIELYEV